MDNNNNNLKINQNIDSFPIFANFKSYCEACFSGSVYIEKSVNNSNLKSFDYVNQYLEGYTLEDKVEFFNSYMKPLSQEEIGDLKLTLVGGKVEDLLNSLILNIVRSFFLKQFENNYFDNSIKKLIN